MLPACEFLNSLADNIGFLLHVLLLAVSLRQLLKIHHQASFALNYFHPLARACRVEVGILFICCFGISFVIKFASLYFESEAWW